TLELVEQPEGFSGSIEYNADVFDRPTIDRLAGHYRTLLEAAVTAPTTAVGSLPLLTPPERRQIVVEWNDTRRDHSDRRLHELVRDQVERTPDAIAVSFEGTALTYRELDRRANQLARRLLGLGARADELV